ncbi:MAG: hypothetical protein ACOX2O_07585 [Bdellovibrionota bacterium]|jgi:hypothetical protein
MRHNIFTSLLIFVLLTTSSCATKTGLNARLAGRGPLALSNTNPYIASNLLLAEKSQSSNVVSGFLQYRGLPLAIEVKQNTFSFNKESSTILYYPREREAFTIEELNGEIVVTGPTEIEPVLLTEIELKTRNFFGSPAMLEGTLSSSPRNNLNVNTSLPPTSIQQNIPERRAEIVKTLPTPQEEESLANLKGLSLIKKLQSRKNIPPAEITPKGDLVHNVVYEGETLSMIVRWYTHDLGNIGRVTRLNKLARPDHLRIGDSIIIPKYLIKSKLSLTQEAVEHLR